MISQVLIYFASFCKILKNKKVKHFMNVAAFMHFKYILYMQYVNQLCMIDFQIGVWSFLSCLQ